jgi:hypothetical protein
MLRRPKHSKNNEVVAPKEGRMSGEWRLMKNLEGSGVCLTLIQQRYLPLWTQENHDKS